MATGKGSKRRKYDRDFDRTSIKRSGLGRQHRMVELFDIFTIGHPRTRGEDWPIVDGGGDIDAQGTAEYWADERAMDVYYDWLDDQDEYENSGHLSYEDTYYDERNDPYWYEPRSYDPITF